MTRENKMMRQFNPKKLQQALIVNKKSTGYSYWDISDLSTLTVAYIYKWINTPPKDASIKFLVDICNYLQIDVNYFVSERPKKKAKYQQFDYQKFSLDMINYLHKSRETYRECSEKLGINHTTVYRITQFRYRHIQIKTILKIINLTDKPLSRYIITKPTEDKIIKMTAFERLKDPFHSNYIIKTISRK